MRLVKLIITAIIMFSSCINSYKKDKAWLNKVAQEELSLNGVWAFSVDSTYSDSNDWWQPGFLDEDWDGLKVPGNWDVENAYANFVGTGYYRKEFVLPVEWKGGVIRLCFGAVYQSVKIWVNGGYVGKHVGGYTPFEFDVTNYVQLGKINTIALLVNNEYGRGAWWHWGGISRDVKLVHNNKQRIVAQQITTEPNLENGSALVSIAVRIKNHENKMFNGRLNVSIENIQNGKKLDVITNYSVSIEPLNEKAEHFNIRLTPHEVQLWNLETPNLYLLDTKLSSTEFLLHKKKDHFGIRKIETKGTKVLLNGKEIHLNGLNRVADHRAYGQTEPDELINFDIDAMKAMGCNFTRINHHPQSKNLLNYCDKVGMLLIEEIPVWQDDPHLYPDDLEAKIWLEELITRDYNHPSVVGWSVGNEIHDGTLEGRQMSPRVYGYVESMINHVKKLDSTRLTTYVSFTAGKTKELGVDPADVCDLISFTCYGDASKVAKRVHEIWPNKPIFVAEIGLKQFNFNPEKAELPQNLIRAIKNTQALEYVAGVSLWTYNDYRSTFKGTPPGQERTWGVYNVWRQPKKAAYDLQKIFATKHTNVKLPILDNPLPKIAEDKPTILTVVPLENSCMIGFTVLDVNDNYEIEYTRENEMPRKVKIIGLRGAAKIYNLESGLYTFRIRKIKNGKVGDWSDDFKKAITTKNVIK